MEGQQTQQIIDLPKVAAGAVASPLAALLTSRFGVAGTMIGLTLSAVIVTVVADALKVYLARVPGAVTSIPSGIKKKSPRRRRPLIEGLRSRFSKFSSLSPERRGYILGRSAIAMVIVFLVGLVVVTGLELGVGKNLSCWVWNDCSSASSADGTASKTSNTYTLPSILGGGASTGSNAPQEVGPSNPQQSAPPATGGTPSQPSNAPGSKTPTNPSVQPGRQQSPSSGTSDNRQQSPSSGTPDNQSQSPSSGTSDNQSQSPTSGAPDNQSQSPSSGTPDSQQQSPPNNSGGGGDQQAPPSSSPAPQGSAEQQQAP